MPRCVMISFFLFFFILRGECLLLLWPFEHEAPSRPSNEKSHLSDPKCRNIRYIRYGPPVLLSEALNTSRLEWMPVCPYVRRHTARTHA
ncbi:hypothetical protein B0H63DRAFT_467412 [Podospora didyma]|uniref:Secreted protein n=1 Tax=Podospora didyma TaxID=330526 RepID=A0AAE0P0S2_9PEZI|nr:hypothetical protein B0H63DRAFT_467412 [Podospora didyma]